MDPFACFGSDDDDDDDANDETTAATITTTAAQEQSRQLVQRSNASHPTAAAPPVCMTSPHYAVVDIFGAGKGVVARTAFRVGDEILRERAALRIPNVQAAASQADADALHQQAVQRALDRCHDDTKRAFYELSSCREPPDDAAQKSAVGIYGTNSYRLGDDDPYGGLFLTIARMNHSCRPNCHHFWRADLRQQLVFAARDIAVGEELCTTYGPALCMDTAARRAYLWERFAFTCACDMCRAGNTHGGDDAMLQMDACREDISLYAASGQAAAALEAVEQCLSLLRRQRLYTPALVKPILHSGYQIAMGKMGDAALARSYLEQELPAVQHSEGVDSPRALEIQRILDSIVL